MKILEINNYLEKYMPTQIAKSFDLVTMKKILKSFLISATPAVVIILVGQLSNFTFNNTDLNAWIALVVPFVTYMSYRIQKGTITWSKFGWSLLLSAVGAGLILLKGTQFGALADAIIALLVPTLLNAIKEWIAGEHQL